MSDMFVEVLEEMKKAHIFKEFISYMEEVKDFELFARKFPGVYLMCVSQCPSWVKDQQLIDSCALKSGETALMYAYDYLSLPIYTWCVREFPTEAYKYSRPRLNDELLAYCKSVIDSKTLFRYA